LKHCLSWTARAQLSRALRLVERVEHRRHLHAGGIGVALHLAERDRRLGYRAITEADRVSRILPALVVQAAVAVTEVLEIAIAVTVGVTIHPCEGA
jgi:hypothetical protein